MIPHIKCIRFIKGGKYELDSSTELEKIHIKDNKIVKKEKTNQIKVIEMDKVMEMIEEMVKNIHSNVKEKKLMREIIKQMREEIKKEKYGQEREIRTGME